MKILNKQQIYAADQRTITSQGITSYDLMERVALACTLWLLRNNPKNSSYDIFVGKGNNGGDGLAMARLLHEKLIDVRVHVVEFKAKGSPDFEKNLKLLTRRSIAVNHIRKERDMPDIHPDAVIIDAIFGIGLNKPAKGIAEIVINAINDRPNCTISIDLPSGINLENTNEQSSVIWADTTLTLQAPKLNLLTQSQGKYAGSINVIDIGLEVDDVESPYRYQSTEICKKIYTKRRKFTHKGSYGHALIVGGSYGMMGSVMLSTKAALKSGIGCVTCYIPACGYAILQSSLPEAMCETDSGDRSLHKIKPNANADVIGIGPGLGQNSLTREAFKSFLLSNNKKLVVDADALNLLALDKTLLNALPEGSILTPHVGEFRRLAGDWKSEEDKLQRIQALAEKYKVVVVFKDAVTIIASPDEHLIFNCSGNSGLATAGSGDVLTGIITALLAQGYTSAHAAQLGVFIHGRAGDIAGRSSSVESLIATSIIENLGKAFLELHSCPNLQFNSY